MTEDARLETIGRAIADALSRRDFRQACSLFGPALTEALPPRALETVWEHTEERFGMIDALVSTRVLRGDRVAAVSRATFANGYADIVVTFADDDTVIGLSVVPAPGPGPLGEIESQAMARARRRVTLGIPFLIALAFGLAAGVRALEVTLEPNRLYWGCAGWTVALIARAPLSFAVGKRYPPQRAGHVMQIATGVVEEVFRVGTVAAFARTFSEAVNVAFGWAAIELLYGAFASFVAVRLAGGQGTQAEMARMAFVLQGQRAPGGAVSEVVDRAVGALYHAGATLTLAAAPLFAFALIPARGYLEAAPRALGIPRARGLRAVAAVLVLTAGLTAYGKL